MKKIFIGFFIMMSAMCMSITAFALTDGDWEFQLLDNEVTITGYLGDDENVVIPSTLYGAAVTKIDTEFKNAVSIVMPDTVREIPDEMCRNNSKLESVVLSDNIEILGESQYVSVSNSLVFEQCTNLKSIKLPEKLKFIGGKAFAGCTSLENVTLPPNVEEIGLSAFEGCVSIKSINLPSSLKEIETGAFSDTGLTSVYIPGSVETVGSAFAYCEYLESVTMESGVKKISGSAFVDCISLKSVDLPDTITDISMGTAWKGPFEGCSSLEGIILPCSVKVIYHAFNKCSNLREIVVPYGTEYLSGSFGECENLQAVYVPDTIETFDDVFLGRRTLVDSPNAIIYCSAGSYMAEQCKKNSISYLTDNSVNSSITVYYNGTRVSFHEYGQNPELINDRTLVPLRAIFEAMGADVQWDQATQTVTSTRSGVTIKLTIGDSALYKNGQSVPVDVPAQIVNDRTLVPARVIAEAFGADVQWNAAGKAVLINE